MQKKIDFEVKADDHMKYWLAVSEDDVRLVNGKGSHSVEAGEMHHLIWWLMGNPGGKFAIVGKAGGKTVVEVKESRIPSDRIRHAAMKAFSV